MNLVPVSDDDHDDDRPRQLPAFDGKPVSASKLKVTSASGLYLEDDHFAIDDIVHVVLECRVTGVDHVVDEKSGDLERVHKAKVIDITEASRLTGPAGWGAST